MPTPNRNYPLVSAAEYLDTDWVDKLTDLADMVDADVHAIYANTGTFVDPVGAQNFATKAYVDTVAAGLDVKPSVRAATTGSITLSGAQTIDGVSVIAGDRVLVKNQSTTNENGIYVAASGSWSRATDANAWAELPGALVLVEEGSTLGDTGWVCTVNAGGTLGTTAVTWSQFFGTGLFQPKSSNLDLWAAVAPSAYGALASANVWTARQTISAVTGGQQVGLEISSASGAFLTLTDAGNKAWSIGVADGSTSLSLFENRDPSTAGTSRAQFLSGGGMTVAGDFTATGAVKCQADSQGFHSLSGGGVLVWIHGYRSDITGNDHFVIYANGVGTAVQINNSTRAVRFNAYGAGTLVTDASGNITASSDERLKRILGAYRRGLRDLRKMDAPVAHRWLKKSGMDTRGTYYGWTAQGVRKGVPEAVGVDPRGLMTLNDRPILAAVVNSVLSIDDRITELERRLRAA